MAMSGLAMSALLLVRIYRGHGVSDNEVQTAWRETEAIFRSAGISVATIDCSSGAAGVGPCRLPLGPTELVLRLRASGAAPGTRAVTMGFSQVNDGSPGAPVLATVFVDRVSLVARDSGVDGRLLLGRAMAHEIGHLLLNAAQHAARGLMRALWSRDEIRRHQSFDWRFLDDEARVMRTAVATRAGERSMDDGVDRRAS